MRATTVSLALLASAATDVSAYVLTDAKAASRSWGELSSYEDNAESAFGVDFVGLPDGCQVVSQITPIRQFQSQLSADHRSPEL